MLLDAPRAAPAEVASPSEASTPTEWFVASPSVAAPPTECCMFGFWMPPPCQANRGRNTFSDRLAHGEARGQLQDAPCDSPAEVADDAPSEAGVPGRGPERPCLHLFAELPPRSSEAREGLGTLPSEK